MKNNKPKCHWCQQDAETVDYRDNGGVVSKIVSCYDCFNLETDYLIKMTENGKPEKIQA
jgi:hypothetical protein